MPAGKDTAGGRQAPGDDHDSADDFSTRSLCGSSGRHRSASEASSGKSSTKDSTMPGLPPLGEPSSFSAMGDQFIPPDDQDQPTLSDSELEDSAQSSGVSTPSVSTAQRTAPELQPSASNVHSSNRRNRPATPVAALSTSSPASRRSETDDQHPAQDEAQTDAARLRWHPINSDAVPPSPERPLSASDNSDSASQYDDYDDSYSEPSSYTLSSGWNKPLSDFEYLASTPRTLVCSLTRSEDEDSPE